MAQKIQLAFEVKDDGTVVLGKIEKKLDDTDKAANKAGSSLGNFASGIVQGIGQGIGVQIFDTLVGAINAVPSAIVGMTQSVIKAGGDLVDTAARTGILVEAQQELAFAGELSGVSFEKIAAASTKMQTSLVEAPEKFGRIGLSAADLRDMKPEDQLVAIGEAFDRIEDPASRSAAAVEIFGKTGTSLLPILNGDLETTMQRASDLGLVMSSEVAGAADDLGDTIDTLSMVVDSVGKNFGAAVVQSEPLHRLFEGLIEIVGMLSKFIQDNQDTIREWVDAGVVFVASALVEMVKLLGFVIDAWTGFKIAITVAGAVIEDFATKSLILFEVIKGNISLAEAENRLKQQTIDQINKTKTAIAAEMKANQERQAALGSAVKVFEDLRASVEAGVGIVHTSTKETSDNTNALVLNKEAKVSAAEAEILLQNAQVEYNEVQLKTLALLMNVSEEFLRVALFGESAAKQIVDASGRTAEQIEADSIKAQNAYVEWQESMIPVMAALLGVDENVVRLSLGLNAQGEFIDANQAKWEGIGRTFEDINGIVGGVLSVFDALGIGADNAGARAVAAFGDMAGAAAGTAQAIASGDIVGAVIGGFQTVAAGINLGKAIGDLFSSSPAEKAAKQAGQVLGMEVSEEMGQEIVDRAEDLGISIRDSILLGIVDSLQESGRSIDEFGDEIAELMEKTADGTIPLKEGVEEIGKAFDLAKEQGGKAMIAMIQQARDLGLEIPEIAAHVRESLATAFDGLTNVVGNIPLLSPEDVAAQATLISSTFWAHVKEHGLLSAAQTFKELIGTWTTTLDESGQEMDEATARMLAPITSFVGLLDNETFAGIAQGIEGLGDVLSGLADSGYLTVDAFAAIQQQAFSAFQQMQANGATSDQALAAMIPTLAQIVHESERYGFELDANTQALVDMAREQGFAFPPEPQQVMIELLEQIVVLLGGEIPQAAAHGAQQVQDAFDNVSINIPINYTEGDVPGGHGGVTGFPHNTGGGGQPHAAVGIVVPPRTGGTSVVMGEPSTGGEVAAPVKELFGSLADVIASRVAGRVGGGGTERLEVHVHWNVDGVELGRVLTQAARRGDFTIPPSAVQERG